VSRRAGRRALALLAVAVLVAPAADPAWRLTVESRRTTTFGEAVRIRAENGPVHIDLRIAVLAPGRYSAHVVAAGAASDAFASARAIPGLAVAINGGYFDRERRPLGLHMVAGKLHSERLRVAPFSGIAWTDDGGLHLTTVDATPAAPMQALQAGPFLIDPGGAPGIRRLDGDRARRSALAISRDGTVYAVATTAATLHAAAAAIHALPAALDRPALDAALNLDGGPSTALIIAGEDDPIEPLGFVVSAWAFTALDR